MTTETRIWIAGNTYPHRKHLKGLGLKWDAGRKMWTGTQAMLDAWANSVPQGCRVVTNPDSQPCPKCGTYCCGDCQTH